MERILLEELDSSKRDSRARCAQGRPTGWRRIQRSCRRLGEERRERGTIFAKIIERVIQRDAARGEPLLILDGCAQTRHLGDFARRESGRTVALDGQRLRAARFKSGSNARTGVSSARCDELKDGMETLQSRLSAQAGLIAKEVA